MSLDLFSMSLDPRVKLFLGDICFILPVPACHWTCSACHWTPVLKLFLGDLCFILPVQHVIGPVQHVIYLSSMSLDLSSMLLDLSSMSFNLSSMSLDLSSMSFVDDPLSQSSLWAGMKHFLSALQNLLVGNLKNIILSMLTLPAYFASYRNRDSKHNVGV
ncbi:hypothetical protein TNCV_3034611 [Trichonephila clavipes]|nr:hypothetical protein TNCV_3034611 [Trichonephila clavipes]